MAWASRNSSRPCAPHGASVADHLASSCQELLPYATDHTASPSPPARQRESPAPVYSSLVVSIAANVKNVKKGAAHGDLLAPTMTMRRHLLARIHHLGGAT